MKVKDEGEERMGSLGPLVLNFVETVSSTIPIPFYNLILHLFATFASLAANPTRNQKQDTPCRKQKSLLIKARVTGVTLVHSHLSQPTTNERKNYG